MLPSVPYVLHRSSARLNEFSPSLEEELKANAMAATGDRHYASFTVRVLARTIDIGEPKYRVFKAP